MEKKGKSAQQMCEKSPKLKLKKSRLGCVTCKAKRLKCDEHHPFCATCKARNVVCGGYAPKKFIWRNETIQTIAGSAKKFRSAPVALDNQSPHQLKEVVFVESPTDFFAEFQEISEHENISITRQSSFIQPAMKPGISLDSAEESNHRDQSGDNEAISWLPSPAARKVHSNHMQSMSAKTIACEESPQDILTSDIVRSPMNLLDELLKPFDEQDRYMWHFSTETSNFITIYSKRHSPWQRLLIPLAYRVPFLADALCAMAAAHLSDFRVGVRYAEKARQGLIQALSHGDRSEVVLAGFICMSWAEIWLHGVHNGVEYIRYASRLIKSAASSTSSDTVESMNVLSGTSLYMDVCASLSDPTPLEKGVLQAMEEYQEPVDNLLGLSRNLFVLIRQFISAIAVHAEDPSNNTLMQMITIHNTIRDWNPVSIVEWDEDEEDCVVSTAHSFQLAALLYVYAAVPSFSSLQQQGASVQLHADEILSRLKYIPLRSKTITVHMWPLIEASCLARRHDRAWCLNRWREMERKMKFANIGKCRMVVEEVWRRADQGEEPMTFGSWRGVARDFGWELSLS